MGTLLLKLHSVPDAEADEIRSLLIAHQIAFHETPQNQFGMMLPAIWIRDRNQVGHARRLLREYRGDRARRTRLEPGARERAGNGGALAGRLRGNIAVIVLFVVACAGLAYLVAHAVP